MGLAKRIAESLKRSIHFAGGRASRTMSRVSFDLLGIRSQGLEDLDQDGVWKTGWRNPWIECTMSPGNNDFVLRSTSAVINLVKQPAQLAAFLTNTNGPGFRSIRVLGGKANVERLKGNKRETYPHCHDPVHENCFCMNLCVESSLNHFYRLVHLTWVV